MNIDDFLSLLDDSGLLFRESGTYEPASTLATNQTLLLLPLKYESVYVFEYEDQVHMDKDREELIKYLASPQYLGYDDEETDEEDLEVGSEDEIAVEIILENILLVYFKAGSEVTETEQELINIRENFYNRK